MLFSCSVSYRASTSEPLFRQFHNRVLRSTPVRISRMSACEALSAIQREARLHARPFARRRLDRTCAAQQRGAFCHVGQTSGFGPFGRLPVETPPVVLDDAYDPFFVGSYLYAHLARPRVEDRVAHGLAQ